MWNQCKYVVAEVDLTNKMYKFNSYHMKILDKEHPIKIDVRLIEY